MTEFLRWSETTRTTELERYFRTVDLSESSADSQPDQVKNLTNGVHDAVHW